MVALIGQGFYRLECGDDTFKVASPAANFAQPTFCALPNTFTHAASEGELPSGPMRIYASVHKSLYSHARCIRLLLVPRSSEEEAIRLLQEINR